MPIIKYTTQIDPHKTIMEIEQALAGKAKAIQKIYDDTGMPTGFSFMVDAGEDVLNIKIPINYSSMYKILKSENIPNRLKTEEQAVRVSWRVLKDWILAQLVLIDLKIVTLEEVFMPYVLNSKGETLFQVFTNNKQLLLTSNDR